MFSSKSIIALIFRPISPSFDTFAMLKIILPCSFVLSSINMLVYTKAISFIILPLALVNITIYVYKLALAMSSIFFPVTYIFCSIWPCLFSISVSKTSLPFTYINSTCLEFIWRSSISFLIRVKSVLRNGLFTFFISEIFTASDVLTSEQRNVFSSLISSKSSLDYYYSLHVFLQVSIC